jgi:hypothetical protein
MEKCRALLTEGEGCDGKPLTMELVLWRVFLTVQNQFTCLPCFHGPTKCDLPEKQKYRKYFNPLKHIVYCSRYMVCYSVYNLL